MGSCRNIAAIAVVGSNPKSGACLSMICMRSFFQIFHVSSGFDCSLTLSHGMAVAQDLVKKKKWPLLKPLKTRVSITR